MSNGGFLLRNICFGVTPTCTTLAAGYSAANASNNHPSQAIVSTGTTLTVKYDFGAAKTMTGASVHNHNIIVAGSTVKVQFGADGTTWANDEAFTIPAAVTVNGITRYPDMFKIFSTSRSYRYALFSFTVMSGTVQVGELFIGTSWQFPDRNFQSSFTRFLQVNKIINGNVVTGYSERYGYNIALSGVAWTYATQYEDLIRAKHVVFIPNYAGADCCHGLVIPGQINMTNLAGASTWFDTSLSFLGSPVSTQ